MNKKERRLAAKAAAASNPEKGTEPKNDVTSAPATEVKPKKEKTTAQKDLNKANAVATVKEITDKKDLKYIYPEDQNTLEKRKKFRAGVRAKIRSFEKQVKKLMDIPEAELTKSQKKDLVNAEKEFATYSKTVLVAAKIAKKAKPEPAQV